ncbi:GH32 C-terminal domain-containing protein [Verrucomicrobiota bacterium sgz303538]
MRADAKISVCAVLVKLIVSPVCLAQDRGIAPFGERDYGAWRATGTSFKNGPASGEQLRKLEIENVDNNRVASSEIEGDGPTGTLTSPPFQISKRAIAFRIGGGNYETHTCINLLIGGKVVKSATGWKSDRLVPVSWDVSQWMGQTAELQLVDAASGDWGHINVADISQTDSPEEPALATGPLYGESLRPQFHFTARQWTVDRLNPGQRQEGWINDLNGLIYYEGEYHLFAQRWAKCWLHAVSTDLIHWKELEPAFWEESLGSGVQSGTCVIDYGNTSGLSPDPSNPAMIAFWSRFDNRAQCLSYSLDRGRTWKHYEKNPFMVVSERDPQVFWYAPGRHWVMMLYGEGKYHLFTSKNLLEWKDERHPIPESFECPDLFELPVDGRPDQMKWVLVQGNGNYSIGSFDGTKFTEESKRYPCDVGPNFYATQSWHNTETGDGRRIQCAWMRGADFVDMPFSQMISFPCELTLRTTPDGLRIFRRPIQEIAKLHRREEKWSDRVLAAGQTLPLAPSGQLFHVLAEVEIPDGAKLTFNLRGVPVVLTASTIEAGHKPASTQGRIGKVELLIDRTSIEAFVNDGEISCTRYVLPRGNGISLTAQGGAVRLVSLRVYPLKSAWAEAP